VSRTGHEDILKLRIEKVSPEIGSTSWEEGFKKYSGKSAPLELILWNTLMQVESSLRRS